MGDAPDRRTRNFPGRLFGFPWGLRPVRLRLSFSFGGRGSRFRSSKRRADARSALSYLSDARRAEDLPSAPDLAKEASRRARLKQGTSVAGLVALFVFGVVISIFGARGYRDLRQSRRELEDLTARLEAQQEKVSALRREVQRLKDDPSALERIAREELGYARPGEVTFLLPGEDPPGMIPRLVPPPPVAPEDELDRGKQGGTTGRARSPR